MAEVVEVEGADTFARTLHGAASELDNLTAASSATGQLIRERAASRAPKRTGALARSIVSATDGSTVTVSSGLIYAPVIHFGWAAHGITPNPYLIPAAVDSEPIWLGYYVKDIDSKLSKVRGA
jgi:hypothetical protein